jgi:hypothetical protein
MRRLTPFFVPFLATLAVACAAPAPDTFPPATPAPAPDAVPAPEPPMQACTRIGCEDGWSVEIGEGVVLPETYTIRVVVDDAVVASRTCSSAQPCGAQVFLAGVTAEEAQLEIVGGAEPLRWTVRPEYSVVQPNGPDCPPTCTQARVVVRMGG